jgi:hypothetical protein
LFPLCLYPSIILCGTLPHFLCDFVNRFANDIRYPHKYEVNDSDVQFSLNAVEKIKNIKPIINLKNNSNDENDKKEDELKQSGDI